MSWTAQTRRSVLHNDRQYVIQSRRDDMYIEHWNRHLSVSTSFDGVHGV